MDLNEVLPKFHQHVKCATRGASTLDKTYSNVKQGFRAIQLPHLGQSDHMSLFLIPAYTPIRKRIPTTVKTIRTWPADASLQLQDCFKSTNWDVFEHLNLEQYTTAVLAYIRFCMDCVTVEKRIRIYPNKKPWINNEVRCLLRERNKAFRAGDAKLYSTARANLKRGIRAAKTAYCRKIENCFATNNHRQVWQGVQHITNYKNSRRSAEGGDLSLVEDHAEGSEPKVSHRTRWDPCTTAEGMCGSAG